MMPGAMPAHPAYGALQDWLREGRGRTVHFHWVENGSAYPLPGQPLPPRHVIDAAVSARAAETDYAALARGCGRFEEACAAARSRVTTPAGTDLRFRIGTRPVNRQDGDASAARTARGVVLIDREIELPAGVVAGGAPRESVEGTIAFPPSQWDGRAVEGLKLRFERGGPWSVRPPPGARPPKPRWPRAAEAGRAIPRVRPGRESAAGGARAGPWILTTATAPAWCACRSATTSNWAARTGAATCAGTSSPTPPCPVNGQVWVKDGRLTVP